MRLDTVQLYIDYGPSWLTEPPLAPIQAVPIEHAREGTFAVTELDPATTLVPGDMLHAGPDGRIDRTIEPRRIYVAMVGLDITQEDVDIAERVATWNRAAYAVQDTDLVAYVASEDDEWLAENVQSDPAVTLFELERTPDSDMTLEALVDRRFEAFRTDPRDDFDQWMEETD